YLGNEEATRATIDQNGWYHSGDIGYYDRFGALHIVDRIKEMIKYRHWSVFPAEIEDFLHRHRAVDTVCVVGVSHIADGEWPRAFVQLAKGESVSEQELIELIKGRSHTHTHTHTDRHRSSSVNYIPIVWCHLENLGSH